MVEGYLRRDNPKFLKEVQEDSDLAADLLEVVRQTLKTMARTVTAIDPFSGDAFPLNNLRR